MKKHFVISCLLIQAAFLAGQNGMSYADEIVKFREEYKAEFLTNQRSPLKGNDLHNLRFFEPDERFRIACTFRRTPDEKPFEIPTSNGKVKPFVKYGALAFEWKGKKHELSVYQNRMYSNVPEYANHLFLPFRDLTNGETTYGGGRYIDLTTDVVNSEQVFLDFNKCYNPWCSYSDGYSCPIPPAENNLEIAVEAGEKMFAGEKKH